MLLVVSDTIHRQETEEPYSVKIMKPTNLTMNDLVGVVDQNMFLNRVHAPTIRLYITKMFMHIINIFTFWHFLETLVNWVSVCILVLVQFICWPFCWCCIHLVLGGD